MIKINLIAFLVIILSLTSVIAYGGVVVTNVPDGYTLIPIYYFPDFFVNKIAVSHNSAEQINREKEDPAIIKQIVASCGLSNDDLNEIKILIKTDEPDIDTYGKYDKEQVDRIFSENYKRKYSEFEELIDIAATNRPAISLAEPDRSIFQKFVDICRTDQAIQLALNEYVCTRESGHTKEYALASLQNDKKIDDIEDPDLKTLVEHNPDFPAFWPYEKKSVTFTNDTGLVYRQGEFTVVDADIACSYMIELNADGSYRSGIMGSGFIFDSKDVDPRYTNQIHVAEKAVGELMIKEGATNRIGSCRRFWELKKEKLKEMGIEWRSPDDLNPGTCFD